MATTSVYLNVHDAQKSIDWYKALGFTVGEQMKAENGRIQYVEMKFEGTGFALGEIAANDDEEFQQWCSTPLGAGVMVHINVDDVKAVWEKAKRAGAVVEAPLDKMGESEYFILNDPDGYVIMFVNWTE